jgi:hypothetical protein
MAATELTALVERSLGMWEAQRPMPAITLA